MKNFDISKEHIIRKILTKDDKNVELEEKLKFNEDMLNSFNSSLCGINDSYFLRSGEIVKIKKMVLNDIYLSSSKVEYALVLCSSNKYQPNVMICPLILKNERDILEGVDIGFYPNISEDKNLVCAIHGIKNISKLYLYKNKNNIIEKFGQIHLNVYIDVLNSYQNLLKKIAILNVKKEQLHTC